MKTTFVLKSDYAEPLEVMNDEQVGKLFRMILHYTGTGEVLSMEDPMIQMMFAVIRQQLDSDSKKYEETCKKRSEAASRAGKISAEKRALQKQQEEQQNPTNGNERQQIQHDNEYDCEYECDNDNDNVIVLNKQQQRQQDVVEYARAREAGNADDANIVHYGKQNTPTTHAELEKCSQFAENLFARYHTKQPSRMDLERVFEAVYRPNYTANDEAYAAFDQTRADLLEFAFQQASDQNLVKWSYINTILDKYRKHHIETAEQAEDYEYRRNRGEAV